MQFNEDLRQHDLRNLVDKVFEIDSYRSKMGEDKDIVVLSFTVEQHEAAQDLVNFIERGYDFVLDADSTPGELDNGKYKVFVELERNKKISEQVLEIVNGVQNLSGNDAFKFRYYKSFRSKDVTEENLTEEIPNNSDDYELKLKQQHLNNFSNFFNSSYAESIEAVDDELIFHKPFGESVKLRIKDFGPIIEVYENLKGPIMLETNDIAEVLFLTKSLGNYNITKINNLFVFEKEKHAVVMEKI